jgi:hypothetical protein
MRKEQSTTRYQGTIREGVLQVHLTRAVLRSCTASIYSNQQAQAPQADGNSVRCLMQQHLSQKKIHKIGLLVQVTNSFNSDTLNVTTAVQQIMTDISEAVSEEDKIMVITMKKRNLMNQICQLNSYADHCRTI